jgi:hypothetical protein
MVELGNPFHVEHHETDAARPLFAKLDKRLAAAQPTGYSLNVSEGHGVTQIGHMTERTVRTTDSTKA